MLFSIAIEEKEGYLKRASAIIEDLRSSGHKEDGAGARTPRRMEQERMSVDETDKRMRSLETDLTQSRSRLIEFYKMLNDEFRYLG